MTGSRNRSMDIQPMPDTSDVSFQIPSFHGHALLSEDTWELGIDAFDDESGVDHDPFTTPLRAVSRRMKHAPLTLDELTPRREKEDAAIMMDQQQQPNNVMTSSRNDEEKDAGWQKDNQTSVRHTLPKKKSVDDMFERRKRDNYQHMGIDLSSKSTARLRGDVEKDVQLHQDSKTSAHALSSNLATMSNVPVQQQARTYETYESYITDTNKTSYEPKPKRHQKPILDKDAGIAKNKPRVTKQPKSILRSSKPASTLPPSLARSLTAASHSPQAERPKWEDVVSEVQQTNQRRDSAGSSIATIGGGLIDVLVKYGEKLKGSLGFSSSASMISSPQASSISADVGSQPLASISHDVLLDGDPTHHTQGTSAGPSSRPLTLSDLTPSNTTRHPHKALTLSNLSPSKQMPPTNGTSREQPSNTSPMHPSRKRVSNGTPTRASKKGKLVTDTAPSTESSQISSKHGKNPRTGPAVKSIISKPMPLASSRTVNKAQPVRAASGHRLGSVTARDLMGKTHGKSITTTHSRRDINDKEQQPPVNLTAPTGPVFADDVYRQLALEKTQRERETRDARGKEKRNVKARTIPHFSKPAPPARPAVRPTIPAAFTFHSDARAAQRNAEFEEKRKTWESHATRQALPIPNFAAMHAAQAEAARSRRVVPVLPTAGPVLTTMARAKDRERFDAERREREKDIERQLALREREKAEEEEREYREARKRTVPKAHEVPEWYKDLRKRKEIT